MSTEKLLRKEIGISDRKGTPIRVGDVFEFDDRVYIISEDEEGYFARVYENQVEYGVEEDAIYEEIGYMDLSDLEFENAEIIGSIEDKIYKGLWERE